MSEPKLKVDHVFPPIPVRNYDYCAYEDGKEENGQYGWGPTAADAIQDWKENYEEGDE